MHPLEKYLHDLREFHSTGGAVAETSYYSALSGLLDAVGAKLAPRVRAIAQLASHGAGSPDFGLYAANQFQTSKDHEPLAGQLPERGVVEVKGVGEDARLTTHSDQVAKYLQRYGQVLVTNYREFILVGKGENGKPSELEAFRIGDSEVDFWRLAADARDAAARVGNRLLDYLSRVMLRPSPLSSPEDVAWFLASYAREARGRIEAVTDLPGLQQLRAGLEQSLGMEFDGKDGEHFFRSTLVQTLFYGVFSSWVIWDKQNPGRRDATFSWKEASWNLHVPMIAALFSQVATPQQLKPLGIDEVLDWTGAVLNRVNRDAFFRKFEQEHAVQYFYEPFLKAFDPELRKDLGVWYTPPEIVRYQVARVDAALREELGIQDGLADPSVYVLDPCCGTGAYLVETLRRIHSTLQEKDGALAGQKLKRAAMERVFGFELLPAPFVISHLQLGLLLSACGAGFNDQTERSAVYLTNALTGWEPPEEAKKQIAIPEMQSERDSADRVKQTTPILVIIGNPPYNAFAGVNPMEKDSDEGLVAAYKEGLISRWGIKKFNLDELYVRFFRIAEKRIGKTERGIVSFISNYSWTSEPSFVVLRERLLKGFDAIWIDNMHGNRKISEYAPDGTTSETVFAMGGFSPGIKQGVVISLWVKKGAFVGGPAEIRYRNDFDDARASDRRNHLLRALSEPDASGKYLSASPSVENRYSFRPNHVASEYLSWPRLNELCAESPSNGLMEKRGGALIDTDRAALVARMGKYLDKTINWDLYKTLGLGLVKQQARFDPQACRLKVNNTEAYSDQRIQPYAVRPFDNRWCYYSPVRPLWNEPRPALWAQCWKGNGFFLTRLRTSTDMEGVPAYFVTGLSDDHILTPDASCFPLRIRLTKNVRKKDQRTEGLFASDELSVANLSGDARRYLRHVSAPDPDYDAASAGIPWMHALAITYSGSYLSGNVDGIRQDWPRIPLPDNLSLLLASAQLGREVAALLDSQQPVPGVTVGKVRPELRVMGIVQVNGPLDLEVRAGWGRAGKDGATMPGTGVSAVRQYSSKEMEAIRDGVAGINLTEYSALGTLGGKTCDIYLNDTTFWQNVPQQVWEYRIGGYQVIKKWLSYREYNLMGRALTLDEAEYITHVVRRIAAILLLAPRLDANYLAVTTNAYSWPGPAAPDRSPE